MGNSFGQLFRISTFGESHGPMIGAIIDGCPAGFPLDTTIIQAQLDRRKPGQSKLTTQRKESDTVQIASGVFEGYTTGTPIALLIPNEDARSRDYDHLSRAFRPSHADYTYWAKYGRRDHRGGGRSSARETALWVAAGAVAEAILAHSFGIQCIAWVKAVGSVEMPAAISPPRDRASVDAYAVRCPHGPTAAAQEALIQSVRKDGDTVGGIVAALIHGVPAGWGEPVFDKLHANLAKAMMSINAAKGFEYGSGFKGAQMRGSAHNDLFIVDETEKVRTQTNFSGGIQGGISNGETIDFRVAFKPVATLLRPQMSIDEHLEPVEISGKGRHDPCVVPRAVPIVEAMAALTLMDAWLHHRAHQQM
jgi:chorismate synthase